MADYTTDQNDAYKDILEAGTLGTISRVVSTYDEVEEAEVITSVTADTVALVSVPMSETMKMPYENDFIEDYKKGKSRFFYVAGKGLTFEPEAGDLLFFNSKIWEIAGTTPLNPDGATNIIFTVGAKVSNMTLEDAYGSDFAELYEDKILGF